MAQTQDVNLSVAGLYTAPNDFSGVPPGALDDALNVAIDQKNLLASRRGFNWFGDTLSDKANRTSSYTTSQIAATSTEYELARLLDDTLVRSAGPGETAGSWHSWPGTFPDPSSTAKSRFLEFNRRKYILTSSGPKLLDLQPVGDGGNIATQAGVPKALDLVATAGSEPGFMDPNIAASTTCTLTSSSAVLTAVSDLASIEVGMYASAPGDFATLVVQDLTYTAIVDGTFGNSITITYVNPGAPGSPLSVSVSGTDITVSLETDGGSALISTADDIAGAIAGSDASTLVDVDVSGTGSNVQAAAVQTPLAGGAAGPIPAGSVVDSITDSVPIITQTGDTTAGSTSLSNLASNAGIIAGVLVSGEGIQDGTTVVSISPGPGPFTVTLDKAAYRDQTGVSVAFSSAPSITLTNSATGSGTSVVTFYRGSQVGYRLLFIGRDAINNQLLYGSPTGIAIAVNTMPTPVAVSVVTNLPSNLTMGPSVTMYVQLYRSDTTQGAYLPPLDQMQLVYEAAITPGDITAGRITILDQTPDSLKGIPLYTGSDREGILQANDPPPLCADAALYRDMVLYANCTNKPALKLTLLGVSLPGGSGLQEGDVITLTPSGGSPVDFTAVSTTPASPGEFQVITSGTPAQNIADTANNLISAINYAPGLLPDVSPVYAFLVSGTEDLPGQILLQSKDYTEVSVSASLHGDTAWSPSIAPSADESLTTEALPNTILVAKPGQGVSVPSANAITVGDPSASILRVLALREYAIVLKTDGIYRITGLTPSTLVVTLFDNTTRIVGPETAAVLTNAVWMLSNQGVVSVSDTGVQIRSDPIKNLMDALTGPLLDHTKSTAFAQGYETEKKYILAAADNSGDDFSNVQYVFNYITNAWTYWDRSIYAMNVAQNQDRLYIANADTDTISRERHDGTDGDLCDEDIDVTIISVIGDQVVLDTVDGVDEGSVIERSSDLRALIVAIDELTNTVTVEEDTGITAGAATIKTAIKCVVQWKPVVNGANPAYARQYSEGVVLFRSTRFSFGTIGFFTDADNSIDRVDIVGYAPGAWGFFPWGSIPWGGIIRPQGVRFLIPQDKQYASQLVPILTIQNAMAPWTCQGLSISANPISQEVPSAVTG